MIRHYFKIAWRNFFTNKFYTFINVFGLSLGMACSILLFLFIHYHASFDSYHRDAKNIYRIVTDLHIADGSVFYDQGSPLVLGQTLASQTPSVIKEGIFLKNKSFTVAIKKEDRQGLSIFYEKENIAFANNDLLGIFSFDWLSGDARHALTEPNTAVISSALAKKYFNTDEVLGKTIRLDDKYDVVISGVLAANHQHTDITAELFISLPSFPALFPDNHKQLYAQWNPVSSSTNVFILLKNGTAQKDIDTRIAEISTSALGAEAGSWIYHTQALSDLHFNLRYGGSTAKPLLIILGLIGCALLFVGTVNFINMAMSRSLTRTQEISTRKALGSSRKAIFWQFITETSFIVLAAAVVAVCLVLLFLPALNHWLQLSLPFDPAVFLFLIPLLLGVVFSAGLYPAIQVSGLRSAFLLKKHSRQSGPSTGFRQSLLIILQHVIAQSLIACTLIISLQVRYLSNADMGFDKHAVLLAAIPKHELNARRDLNYLRNQLSAQPAVKGVSFCYSAPAATSNKGGSIRFDGRDWEKFIVNSIIGDEQYLNAFGIKLIAGRNLSTRDTSAAEYLVNERLLASLGLKKPEEALGRTLVAGDFGDRQGLIVGVVKDFNTRPLNTLIEPTLITADAHYYQYAAIKINASQSQEVLAALQQTWKSVFPQTLPEYHFLDQQIVDFYKSEEMINKLIKAGALIAIVTSCLGLLGLLSLITVQRSKEIAIRKVLGASVANITALLSKNYLKLVVIAILIATPIAYWVMSQWLQHFAYRITLSGWIFTIAAAITTLIAMAAVSLQSIKASTANPIKSLRGA